MKKIPEYFRLDYRATILFYAQAQADAAEKGGDSRDVLDRQLGSSDLFYLLVFICKRADLLDPWLFERCREVQRDPNGHLDLWAREHYKSTIITFGLTLLDIINDPEITIGIFSHTKPVAKKFLSQIKTEMETNADLHRLWPDIFWQNPQEQAPKWSEDDGIIVKRTGNPKEATLEANGLVKGMPTGRHYKGRIYDDVVTLESVSTPEQIAKTTNAWRLSDNLGSIGGWVRYIGTRYHLFDTYSTMIEDKVAIPRIRAATVDGTEYGAPVLMPPDVLLHKRAVQGPYVFAAQMLLNPTADKAMGFRREWLVHGDVDYHEALRKLWRFIICDPAGGKQRQDNDYTTFWVIGHGEDGKYRVLQMIRDRMSLTTRGKTAMALHRKWTPGVFAYEEYGLQADIEFIKYLQAQELYEFQITPLGGAMSKPLRILRLVPYFENGYKDLAQGGDGVAKSRIILPTSCLHIDYQGHNRDMVADFINDEFVAFPVLKHDDMLDGLSRLIDLEALNLIEKPRPMAPETRGHQIEQGLRNTSKTSGAEPSWLTV